MPTMCTDHSVGEETMRAMVLKDPGFGDPSAAPEITDLFEKRDFDYLNGRIVDASGSPERKSL